MKRTTIPAAVAIAAAGALGFAALPAAAEPSPGASSSAEPGDKSEETSDDTDGAGDETDGAGDETDGAGDDTDGAGDETDGAGNEAADVVSSAAVEDVTMTVDVEDATAAEINESGVTVTLGGAEDEDITGSFTFLDAEGGPLNAWFTEPEDATPNDDGTITAVFGADIADDFVGVITVEFAVSDGEDERTITDTFTVVADDDVEEAPAERQLVIEPEEVTAADFVDEEKGVQIAATGFAEGEDVTLEVIAGSENVEGVELYSVADEDGIAYFGVYGTNASEPSVYIGSYAVEVTGADDAADDEAPLTGSFEVVSGAGSDVQEPGEAGGAGGAANLPRTGAELGGLGLGLGLLVAGGAAVLLSTRRAKVSNGPADV